VNIEIERTQLWYNIKSYK